MRTSLENPPRAEFLARLPLLFAASRNIAQAVSVALHNLTAELEVETATIFLNSAETKSLTFWAIDGVHQELISSSMPADRGIVGWVIQQQQSVRCNEVQSDPRFFSEIDKATRLTTRQILCVPLSGAQGEKLGAIQLINKKSGEFSQDELEFLELVAPHVVLGLRNATLAEKLERTERKLQALQSKRSEMITVITHEFRTPLGIVQTAADLISRGKLSPDQIKDTAATLGKGVQRLLKIVGDIRNSAVVSAEVVPILPARVDVGQICQTICESLEGAAREVRKVHFAHAIDSQLLTQADEALIALALHNLLHNAIRFTPDGGSISVKAVKRFGSIVVSVQDTGIGVPQEQQEAIFEKFYEVGNSLAHSSGDLHFKAGGLGLGLATAQAILKAHGSSLELKSRKGEGSEFSFRLRPIA